MNHRSLMLCCDLIEDIVPIIVMNTMLKSYVLSSGESKMWYLTFTGLYQHFDSM